MEWFGDETDLPQMRERIEALELEHKHALEDAYSRRQDRWHATRDAAVSGYLSNAEGHETDLGTLMELAEAAADAAHGPLEGKAPDNLVSTEGWGKLYTREAVDALVQAARRIVGSNWSSAPGVEAPGGLRLVSCEDIRELEEAVKPFEVDRG